MNALKDTPPETSEADKHQRIRTLNDAFRTSFIGGHVMLTKGIHALGEEAVLEITRKVQAFNDFSLDNDPYGEHDFGSVEHDGQKVFWKMGYYDKSLTYGSNDPSDPEQTVRVLTVMLAEEY